MDPLISVIVPVYNVEKYLHRCVESICTQTYRNLEILLIDDGSTDKSGELCDEFAGKDNRIRVVHKKNEGVSAARNDGLELAAGTYVTFLDSDDYIASEMYEILIGMICDEDADIAICGYAKEVKPGEFMPYWKEQVSCSLSRQEQLACLMTNRYFSCSVGEMLFRKVLLAQTRFDTSKRHNEDYLFIYEVMKKSRKAVYTSLPLLFYCTNQGSATTSRFSDAMLAIIDVNEYIYSDIQSNIPELTATARKEFVRNNLTAAMRIARDGYQNQVAIQRIRRNVRGELAPYLRSGASRGYKLGAALLSANWRLFRWYANWAACNSTHNA